MADSESLTVKNSMSFKDILFCTSMPKHPVIRIAENAVAGFCIYTGVLFIAEGKLPPLSYSGTMAFFFAVMPLFRAFLLFRNNQKRKTLEPTLTIDSKGLFAQGHSGAESKTDWKAISSISKREGATVIQISKKPDLYYWIPDKRFASQSEADHFFAKAKEYWENMRFPIKLESADEVALIEYTCSVYADIKLGELIKYDYCLQKHLPILGLLMLLFTIPVLLFHTATLQFLMLQVCIGILFLYLPAGIAKGKFKNHPDWMNAQVSINSDFLNSKGKQSGYDNRIVWTSVRNIFRLPGALCYSLDKGFALCIPVRCFPTAQEADKFFQLSIQYWNTAKESKTIEEHK